MNQILDGRSAIVTGAGRGIGRGIALCLARDGAEIAVGDIMEPNAQAVADEIRQMGQKAIAVCCDVGTRSGATQLVSSTLKAFGKVDILINNAGVVGATGWQQRAEPNDDDWAEVLRVNLMSRVYCSEAVVPHLKERACGKIVNIASIGGVQGGENLAHYCASKAADINYTQSLAIQLGPHNVNVNAVLPGMLLTDMMKGIHDRGKVANPTTSEMTYDELFDRQIRRVPLRRGQSPEDIGNLVSFLVSDRASNISGQAINVDGGVRMH